MKVEYSSNNSGGGWWLSDDNWYALERAGWKVDWVKDDEFKSSFSDGDGRFLGALATSASLSREGLRMETAIAEWEEATGQTSTAIGCNCCGTPHSFSLVDDDGNTVKWWSPTVPEYGDSYQ